MRSFTVTLILLAALILAVAANSIYVEETCGSIISAAEELSEGGYDAPKTAELRSLWRERKDILSLSIESDELEQMESLIESLCALGEESDSEEFQKCCRLIISLGKELGEYERISLLGLL